MYNGGDGRCVGVDVDVDGSPKEAHLYIFGNASKLRLCEIQKDKCTVDRLGHSPFSPASFFSHTRVMAAVTTGRSIKSRLARYAPFECTADLSKLSKQEHTAIKHLVKAGRFIDQLYFRQHWSGNEALRKKIHEQGDRDLCELFEMYKGPWVRVFNGYMRVCMLTPFHRRVKTMTNPLWRECHHALRLATFILKI